MTNNKLRTNFSNSKNANVATDFLDIQIKSFQDFFQLETKSDERVEEGLFNTFKENFPITDARNQFVLEFLDYFIDPPRYSMHECNKLILVDIQAPDFSNRYPTMDWHALNARIHGLREDGTLITGLDVTHEAWKAVGVGWLYAPLRWPVIRHVADAFYNVFAKHRYTISYLLTGKKRQCDRCIPGEASEK